MTDQARADASSSSTASTTQFAFEEGEITPPKSFRSKRVSLSYFLSLPKNAQAAVLLHHGYGEHKDRYRKVVARWAENHFAVAAADLRGHGYSGGLRGYCDSFQDYLDDAADVLQKFRERLESPRIPIFLFGHSFGGLIAAHLALKSATPFHGLVLSSPFFGLQAHVPRAKELVGKLASRVAPKLALATGLRGSDLTHDSALAQAYDLDPRVNKNATARWFTEAQGAQEELLARAAQLRLPVLLVQAGDDRVASAYSSRAFFGKFGSSDKTYDERPGLFHEILNEPSGLQIADTMAQWMATKIP